MISFFRVIWTILFVRGRTEQPQYRESIVSYRYSSSESGEGGQGPPYEKAGDALRKIWIKPLKETKLGVARALFDPWKTPLKLELAWLPAAVQGRSQRL